MPPLPRSREQRAAALIAAGRWQRFDLDPGTSAPPDASSVSVAADDGPVQLTGLVVPWRVTATRWGVPVHFTPETLDLPDDLSEVKLLVQHDDERPFGYATAASRDPDGLRMTFAVDSTHERGAELLREIAMRWRDGLSVGVELATETQDAIWDAMWDEPDDPIALAGALREVSAVAIPQFRSARIGAGAPALATFTEEGTPPMPPPAPPVTVEATGTAAPEAMSMAELAAQLAPHLNVSTPHPLAVFANMGEFIVAAREGHLTPEQRAAFALADQVTANNPGVIPPAWLTTILGIIERARPSITAFGGPVSPGDEGMTVNWPYYDGGFADLVGEQVTQKTEVTTRRVDIKAGTAELKTYAGASDISYQLLRRSSPKYREAYSRILTIAYGVTSNNVFADALLGNATAATATWPIDGDLDALLAALFSTSAAVKGAVGVPADVVLASTDVFAAIGTLTGLVPPQYGTQNVGGTASASTLTVNVSGLNITHEDALTAGSLLVSSSEAAKWAEDGPFAVEGDDVAKLGVDVGIWGMGAPLISYPGAIQAVSTTAGLPLASSSSSGKSRR